MRVLYLTIISTTGIGAGIAALIIFGNISPDYVPSHEWKSFVAFDIPGLNNTYQVGDTARFFVVKNGYGNMPCIAPKITLYREEEPHILLVNYTNTNIPCPVNMTGNYSIYFPNKTGSFIVMPNETGKYTLNISYGNNSLEKYFTITSPKNTTIFDTGITPMSANVTGTNFTVNYNIKHGQVSEIKLVKPSGALEILLQGTESGMVTVNIPRALIDARPHNFDVLFIVLVDNEEILFKEIHKTTYDRTLLIPFKQGSAKIEIIGAQAI
jgi:hypothetical protein